MESGDQFAKIKVLYHFTDLRNIPSIRENGGLLSLKELIRRQVAIPAPGGNQWSQDSARQQGLDDYVSLCFRNNHPMLHIAKNDGRIENPVFLHIDPVVLEIPGVKFANGVSNKADVILADIADAAEHIDYEILYKRTDWSNPEINARLQAAEKCENTRAEMRAA